MKTFQVGKMTAKPITVGMVMICTMRGRIDNGINCITMNKKTDWFGVIIILLGCALMILIEI
jgi:hypothetical protein